MATYRFLQDAYISSYYYQAGTIASTIDTGGTLPIGWMPNGNVEPIDSSATIAFSAAGPQSAGLIRQQWANLPVQPPSTYWVQNSLRAPPYFAHGIFLDGATALVSAGEALTLNDAKISFAGWFQTDWTKPNLVPWIVDPGSNPVPNLNNNDPQLVGGSGGSVLLSTGYQIPDGSEPLQFLGVRVQTGLLVNVWQHHMGSVDASTGQVFYVVDGIIRSQLQYNAQNTPFSFVPSNGKIVYVGTDTLGDWYTGNICDLSIWFDRTLPLSAYGLLVDINRHPIHPRFYFSSIGIPDVFISGPTSSTLGQPLGGVLPFFVYAGHLQDSTSSPSQIQPI